MTERRRIPPGATIGILGGGQLGRMTALAAATLGYRTHVFSPEGMGPAALVTPFATFAEWEDAAALDRFAASVDVATFEFENVPAAAADRVARLCPVHPSPAVLRTTQHRILEKDFLRAIGVPTTDYWPVEGPAALADALAKLGNRRSVLKTASLGYDGRGQVALGPGADADEAWARMGGSLGVLEAFVPFEREASVIVARGQDGLMAAYPLVENRHVDHILERTIAPADVPAKMSERAEMLACRIARRLDVVGVLAVEMFLGPDDEVLVNELAPRPHNSGHWTIDACATSQFEQLVRAVCGLPLGAIAPWHPAVMRNLIGDAVDTWPGLVEEPTAKLHLYGKTETRPGRKMGHVTTLGA